MLNSFIYGAYSSTATINGELESETRVVVQAKEEKVGLIVICKYEVPRIEVKLEAEQIREIFEFFQNADILSWKLVIPEEQHKGEGILVLILAREPKVTCHISTGSGLKAKHIEFVLSERETDIWRVVFNTAFDHMFGGEVDGSNC